LRNRQNKDHRDEQIKAYVCAVRRQMPRLGTRKLHYLLQQDRSGDIGRVGRDWLFRFLGQHGLLVHRNKKYVRTTDSRRWIPKYPNLVKNKKPSRPEEIWVADITYLTTRQGHRFLHLLTDAYSKKIVGYELNRDMSAVSTVKALQCALTHRQYDLPIIHHSDRGLQYNSAIYTEVLSQADMTISMTQDGNPYDNAVAERINGILKQEYGLDEIIEDEKTLRLLVEQAVVSYNTQRPHFSCWLLTPDQMHKQAQLPIRNWHKKTMGKTQ
jgi:putative transposase